MNGLDKITARIAADAQAQADAILSEGKAQARAITQSWEEKARAESGAILAQGERAAKGQPAGGLNRSGGDPRMGCRGLRSLVSSGGMDWSTPQV